MRAVYIVWGEVGVEGEFFHLLRGRGHVWEGVTDGVKVALEFQATVAMWGRDRGLDLQ